MPEPAATHTDPEGTTTMTEYITPLPIEIIPEPSEPDATPHIRIHIRHPLDEPLSVDLTPTEATQLGQALIGHADFAQDKTNAEIVALYHDQD